MPGGGVGAGWFSNCFQAIVCPISNTQSLKAYRQWHRTYWAGFTCVFRNIYVYTDVYGTAINERPPFERARRSLWEGLEAGKGRGNIIIVKSKRLFLFLKKENTKKKGNLKFVNINWYLNKTWQVLPSSKISSTMEVIFTWHPNPMVTKYKEQMTCLAK